MYIYIYLYIKMTHPVHEEDDSSSKELLESSQKPSEVHRLHQAMENTHLIDKDGVTPPHPK